MLNRLSDYDLFLELANSQARESFWHYRQCINKNLKLGWWQREIAAVLQQFYEDLKNKKRPILVIEAPPQHGKSSQVVDFVTWLAGHIPDCKTIYTSFSERLGVRANLQCQRIYDSEIYKGIFPNTFLNGQNTVMMSSQYLRNRELLEYVGHDGYFRNTTVRGAITGEGLDLGIVDDPIKGREEANSETIRDKTWDWLLDDFFTRFSEYAGLLFILTRWHVDDPVGRLREKFGDSVKVCSYPALAVRDEKHRKKGEPLFPEHKSKEFLLQRKKLMANVSWESLYQQNPQTPGGEVIHPKDFILYKQPPIIQWRAIYADTAQKTKEHNDYSVFECWGFGSDNKIYLLDMLRGKWIASDLENRAIAFWKKHSKHNQFNSNLGDLRHMAIEDKSSGIGLIQNLKNSKETPIPIKLIPRNTDKYSRVLDGLGYIESGYVCLPKNGDFTSDFLKECENFRADMGHRYDDQIDPMLDAISDMLNKNKFSLDAELLGDTQMNRYDAGIAQ